MSSYWLEEVSCISSTRRCCRWMELADSRSRAPSSWRSAVRAARASSAKSALGAFGEDELQLGEGAVEDAEEGLGDDPLLLRVPGGREGAEFADGGEKIVAMAELFDERLEVGLVGLLERSKLTTLAEKTLRQLFDEGAMRR